MAKVTSVRLDDDLADKLETLAVSVDRSKAWLIQQAIESYVEEQSWQVNAIKQALEDYRSGRMTLVSHEEVMKEIEEFEAELEAEIEATRSE